MKILSRLSVRFLQLVTLLFLCAISSAPKAYAQAIKMLPPTGCTGVAAGTWGLLGWDTVNPLSCAPNAGSTGPLIIVKGGNVGIGNTSPGVKLELQGSAANYTTGTEEELKLYRPITSSVSWPQAATFALGTYNNSGGCCGPQSRLDIKLKSGASNDDTTNVTVMTLQDNGNVGIGIANPQGPLEVNGVIYFNGTPGFQSYISPDITQHTNSGFFQTSNATVATGWPENYGTWYHMLSTTHVNLTNYYSMQFASRFFDSDHLYFRATGGSGATAWRQIITTASNGNVGIFTTAPSAPLDVVGGVRGSGASVVAGGGCSPEGMFGYDLTNHKPVYCNGSVWISLWSPVPTPPTVTSMVLYSNQTVGPYSFCAWSGGNAGNNFVQGIYPISGGPGAYMWSITVTTGPQRIDCF